MKAFCMDLHISIIADFKSACPSVEVTDWCLSGHHWVMNRPQDRPLHINPSTWTNLTPERILAFQREYDSFLRQFDMFIVGFAGGFAMVFEKYNKPILSINAVRYDLPFCWTKDRVMREAYHQCLHRLRSKGLLFVVSNSRLDQLYMQRGCGIPTTLIPSLCLYAGIKYAPTRPDFLLYHGTLPDHPLVAKRPKGFAWKDVGAYRGIIHFLYEATPSMSQYEQYTGGMPLFLPSRSFWKEHLEIQTVSAYWGKDQMPPEFGDLRDELTWVDQSDIYERLASPNTHTFDSIPHLFELLETFVYVPEDKASYILDTKRAWSAVLREVEARVPPRAPVSLPLPVQWSLQRLAR